MDRQGRALRQADRPDRADEPLTGCERRRVTLRSSDWEMRNDGKRPMSGQEPEASFRFVVDGDRKLEDVPLREIASMLEGFAALVARGSADILNRPMHPGPGRQEGPIEEASRIRLVSLTSGSIVATVLPAAPTPLPEGGFDLGVETLSEQAIGLVLDVAGGQTEGHADLARALVDFTDRHLGRYEGAVLRLEDRRPDHRREVIVDGARRSELRKKVEAAVTLSVSTKDVTGRLFEANLETNSAKVRTPTGEKVDVQYSPEHEDDIRHLLGHRADLRGEITYDRGTQHAKAIRIREIVTGDQLGLDFGGVDFWTDRPVSQLIAQAGAKPVEDPADLELHGASDGEWAALYEALGSAQ